MLRRRRTPEGTRSSLMMLAPRAASVGATMAPMAAATQMPLPPKSSAATPGPGADGEGEADAEKAGRERDVGAQPPGCSPGRHRRTGQGEGDLGQQSRMAEECRLTWMSAVGPCVTTRPRSTKAIGAEMSQRSSRAETRPQMRMQAETTASTAMSSSLCIAVAFLVADILPGQSGGERAWPGQGRGGPVRVLRGGSG